MSFKKIVFMVLYGVIAAALSIAAVNLFGCSGAIPIPDRMVKKVYEECTGHETRCNGSVSETCTGHQWYPQFDCAAMTVNGDPHPLRCVDGGCV